MAKEQVRKNIHNEALEHLFCEYLNGGLQDFTDDDLDGFFEDNKITSRHDKDYVLNLKVKVEIDE